MNTQIDFARDPQGVERLSELQIDHEGIITAVRAGEQAADSCTTLDTKSARGMLSYMTTVRVLRETHASLGWRSRFDRGLELLRSPDGSIEIAVQKGDENTGTGDSPSTSSPKGESTSRRVRVNKQQLELFQVNVQPLHPESEDLVQEPTTLILLRWRESDSVNFELSLPRGVSEDGRVNTWDWRVIFEPLDLGADSIDIADAESEGAAAIDVSVTPKA